MEIVYVEEGQYLALQMRMSNTVEYLNDHENVKRAEFMGELMSYEQLEELLGIQ